MSNTFIWMVFLQIRMVLSNPCTESVNGDIVQRLSYDGHCFFQLSQEIGNKTLWYPVGHIPDPTRPHPFANKTRAMELCKERDPFASLPHFEDPQLFRFLRDSIINQSIKANKLGQKTVILGLTVKNVTSRPETVDFAWDNSPHAIHQVDATDVFPNLYSLPVGWADTEFCFKSPYVTAKLDASLFLPGDITAGLRCSQYTDPEKLLFFCHFAPPTPTTSETKTEKSSPKPSQLSKSQSKETRATEIITQSGSASLMTTNPQQPIFIVALIEALQLFLTQLH